MGQYVDAADRYMRLALKAQSQCRATIEALAEIKNPHSVAFIKQANVANGPQQVNNGTPSDLAPAGNSENRPNELLEMQRGERLDTRTAGQAIGGDQELETVGAVNGAKDRSR